MWIAKTACISGIELTTLGATEKQARKVLLESYQDLVAKYEIKTRAPHLVFNTVDEIDEYFGVWIFELEPGQSHTTQ